MIAEIIAPRNRELTNYHEALLQHAINRMRQIVRADDDPRKCLLLVIQEIDRLSIKTTGFKA